MEYNIHMRLKGEVFLVEANLSEQEALDHTKTLNLLNNEGEIYYILPTSTDTRILTNTYSHK
jgi:hypothetical protein